MDDKHGWMEVTFRAPCDLSDARPDKQWIENLLRQNPDLTGWPFFVDLWTPRRPEWRPRIREGVWEARMDASGDKEDYHGGIDFWRVDAKRSLFFAARALEDDTEPKSPNPGKTLEFTLAIVRTAEILAVAVRFASFLCEDQRDDDAKVPLTLKWSGLNGRVLSAWASPGRSLSMDYQSHTDVVKKTVELPLSSTRDQITLFTQKIVDDLFLCFDGWVCPSVVVDDLVHKLLSRRL